MHPSVALLLTVRDGPGQRVLRRRRVRVRQDPPDPAPAAGARGPRPGAPAARDHRPAPRLPVGQPARHHAGVADARLAGRAGVRRGDPALAGRRGGLRDARSTRWPAAASLTVITFLHTVLGELAPKALAIQRTESIAMWAAVPFRVFYLVSFPAHLDAQGGGRPGAAHPAPAARVRGGDAALARRAAPGHPARAARSRARAASSIGCSTTPTASPAT